ncbi:hypothetical protein HYV22_00855 [Candidatus Gottesmanbacteria bacterium]|nr:hypothetical protein [Candidatus Gottesmanbacteria bacterium]
MHAFLIIGGTLEKRKEWVSKTLNEMHVSSFDCVKLAHEEGKQMGVTDVRSFTKHLTLIPTQGKFLAGIIEDAHLLTTEAQNAILKTLEEPGPKAILLLETINPELLLPTITSRCQVISLGTAEQYTSDDLFQCFKTLEQLREAGIGERIKMIDTIAPDRDTAKTWIELALAATRQSLLSLTNLKQTTSLLRRLLLAQKQLAANVTPKLVLDSIFLDT